MIKIVVAGVWCPIRGVKIKELDHRVFYIQTSLSLGHLEGVEGRSVIFFFQVGFISHHNFLFTVPFWNQVCDLSAGAMLEKNDK
jgi:hypothetical protein